MKMTIIIIAAEFFFCKMAKNDMEYGEILPYESILDGAFFFFFGHYFIHYMKWNSNVAREKKNNSETI